MVCQFYTTFYIAGFKFWDGVDVFDELKVGTELTLEAEPTNVHDPDAVKILYNETMLGYIPREENKTISQFLQLGHTDLFSAKISKVAPEAHYEKTICVRIKVNKATKNE